MGNSDDSKAAATIKPRHIAVVMDGNGRWATKRLLPRTAGHKAGVNATRAMVENCVRHGIEALTIFAFSSENWKRPEKEVDSLMSLFVKTLASEIKKLHKQNVRVLFIGDRARFNSKLQSGIAEAEALTANNTGLALNIAANYGGRWDIVNACRQLVKKISNGEIGADDIDEKSFAAQLSLSHLPAPDLFIRTGGEQRISNFLLWQSAYSEFYFSQALWPDFDEAELIRALEEYASRQRRFGKTSQQLNELNKTKQQGVG
ncbi:MAG: isoprenyl transferase [Gammaproteobacteria bacterium]